MPRPLSGRSVTQDLLKNVRSLMSRQRFNFHLSSEFIGSGQAWMLATPDWFVPTVTHEGG